jgi:hypothetical protein
MSVVYAGSNPSRMPKKALVISKIGGLTGAKSPKKAYAMRV